MKKTYISGKITGIENEAYDMFESAQMYLLIIGQNPVNPMKLPHNHNKSWEAYMKEDIKALLECDAIYMLENWRGSKGARIECKLADDLGIKIIYQ